MDKNKIGLAMVNIVIVMYVFMVHPVVTMALLK